MTLDPVHLDGIARLAGRVGGAVDSSDHDDLVERAWTEFLDPLYVDGEAVLEPIGERRRERGAIEDVALAERPFPTQHGIDAGTINPTTFKNGLVLDVSQAAMAANPSDVDLHRGRTIVMTVHTNDKTVSPGEDEWRLDDHGYARRRILEAPRVDRYEQTVVHALALYLAESTHALENADVVEDLLVLDGPLYPTGLLKWHDRDPELRRLLNEAQPADVIANYLSLVDRFVERDVPLVGFVKNSASKAITRGLRDGIGAPWVDDDAFWRLILERRDERGDLETDHLTATNWFRSRVGVDGLIAGGRSRSLDVDRRLDPADYEVTFFVVYDPRDDLVYRVEAPYAFTRDADCRERIRRQFLAEVATERGPPRAVGKADSLASIDRESKEALRTRIEREFDTDRQRNFDDRRWGFTADVEGV